MNKKMNRLLWMLVALLSLAACTEDTEYTAGVWYRRSDFDGVESRMEIDIKAISAVGTGGARRNA